MQRYNAERLQKRFGNEVRRRRKERGLTVEGLAALASMSSGHLAQVERGSNVSLAKMGAIAVALGAQSLEEFFGEPAVLQPSRGLLYQEHPQ